MIAMIPVFLIDFFLTAFHINSSIQQAEQLLRSKGEIIAKQIASVSEFNLFSGNYEQVQYLLNQSINTNDIIYSAVYDLQGQTIAIAEGNGYSAQHSSRYFYYRQSIQTQTIGLNDVFEPDINVDSSQVRNLGWVHLYISKQKLQQNKKGIIIEGLIFFCGLLFVAVLLTAFISRRITRPVYTLLDQLKQIETGHLGQVIKNVGNNEIGDVQKGFNSMSQSLLANRMQLDQKIKTATLELMNAISNLEYKNKELAVARDEAQNANRIKSQFLANMSHEIRTPINGIKGFVSLLSQLGLGQEQKRYVDIIEQSTDDLSSIINEVLDLSKLESGKLEILDSAFDLYELVEATRDSLFTAALEKGIDLHLTLFSDTPNMLVGDKYRLKQILINLIGNAIKFTDKGYVNITVFMEDESDDQIMIKFNIEDSGIGISEQNQKSLFQAFNQIESDANRRYSGTGLGLVISKNLAILMGGDITIQSKLHSGSLFELTLPFRSHNKTEAADQFRMDQTAIIYTFNPRCQSELQSLFSRVGFNVETQLINQDTNLKQLQNQLHQDLNYIDLVVFDIRHSSIHPDSIFDQPVFENTRVIVMHYDRSLIDSSKYADYEFISVINTCKNLRRLLTDQPDKDDTTLTEIITKISLNPKKVLLVDDNPVNLTLASELTRLWGHSAFEASNAKQAMKLFTTEEFDLILLDIQMPEIDGVELMQMMRQQRPDLKTPIAAITANVMEMEKERLISLGFNAYISKPINEQVLRDLLDQQEIVIDNIVKNNTGAQDNTVIDYELTLKLSAENKKLVQEIFSILKHDLPGYQDELQQAIELQDIESISFIMHKLEGVSCYSGLPRLKQLLFNYEAIKISTPEKILNLCSIILEELSRIELELDEYIVAESET